MDGAEDMLLLHADTLFESARSRLPGSTISGDTYDLTELASPGALPQHVQFVWHGVNDHASLARFIESGVQWCEVPVRAEPTTGSLVLNRDPIDDEQPIDVVELSELIDVVIESGRSVKLDIMENGPTLDALTTTINGRGSRLEDMWFSSSVDVLGERGFRRLHNEYPGAVIQCAADFLAPLIPAMPDDASRILSSMSSWGVNRLSISWDTLFRRQVVDALEGWGYEINIYNIPDLESFLKAALLLPMSLTADFSALMAGRRDPGCQPDRPHDGSGRRVAAAGAWDGVQYGGSAGPRSDLDGRNPG